MENNVVLKVENLSKSYGSRMAVEGLNFSIHKGEIFGFLGANGAGKSTTMKVITGLASATEGTVTILGHSLKKNFKDAIKNVGAMIEAPQFYSYLTGYQNLKFFAGLGKGVTKGKILDIAHLVGLSSRIYDKVGTYSLGMKQRLGIAQALLTDPKLLVLDEPTNGLDANGIREIKMFLKRVAKEKGVAIMISSHILSIMESMCDTICIIENGKISDIQSLEEIKKSCTKHGSHFIKTDKPNYAGMLIQERFGKKAMVTKTKVLFNATTDEIAEIIEYLTRKQIPIYGAGEIDYSLEDAYLDIIGTENKID